MTTNDFDRTARLWLEDGPTQMSDRALTAALDEIHVTPQRRAWWPARRLPKMNTPIQFAAGAASLAIVVVVALAVDGFNLLPGSGRGRRHRPHPPFPRLRGHQGHHHLDSERWCR